MDDELAELLDSIETDRANLDGYNAAIRAPQCTLYLSRRRSFGQGFHQCAAVVMEFGRNEIEEVPPGHVRGRSFEHPQHCRIGQMDRPVGAGDNHTVWRKLGQQPVPLFARAQRLFSLLLSGDVALCSPGTNNHSIHDNAAQVVQDDFGISVPVHFVCLDIVEVVTGALESTKKLDIFWVRPDQQISKPCAQNLIGVVVAVHSRHCIVALSEVREFVKHFDLIVHRQRYWNRPLDFKTPDSFRASRDEGTVVLVPRHPTS